MGLRIAPLYSKPDVAVSIAIVWLGTHEAVSHKDVLRRVVLLGASEVQEQENKANVSTLREAIEIVSAREIALTTCTRSDHVCLRVSMLRRSRFEVSSQRKGHIAHLAPAIRLIPVNHGQCSLSPPRQQRVGSGMHTPMAPMTLTSSQLRVVSNKANTLDSVAVLKRMIQPQQ